MPNRCRLKRGALVVLAMALLLCAGCSGNVAPSADDPLANYALGSGSSTEPPGFHPSPVPTEVWEELPLGDPGASVIIHPTRKPGQATVESSMLALRAQQRDDADLQRCGAPQVNVSAQCMAALHTVGDVTYIYFTDVADGRLHRTNLAGAISDEEVNSDRALCLTTAADGSLLYINDNRQIIRLSYDEQNRAVRTPLITMDDIRYLARWDDSVYFVGGRGIAQGVYLMQPDADTRLIVSGAQNVLIDSLNERLLVIGPSASGDNVLRSLALDGSDPFDIIEGDVQAFAYYGDRLFFSTDDAIYSFDADGDVRKLFDSPAEWLGVYGGSLFYLDSLDLVRQCHIDGSAVHSPVDGIVYNLSFYEKRLAYATSPDSGIVSTVSIAD